MWVSSPLSIAFAQNFLSPEVCEPCSHAPARCIDDNMIAMGPIFQSCLICYGGQFELPRACAVSSIRY
jgi:hypothetical protein